MLMLPGGMLLNVSATSLAVGSGPVASPIPGQRVIALGVCEARQNGVHCTSAERRGGGEGDQALF